MIVTYNTYDSQMEHMIGLYDEMIGLFNDKIGLQNDMIGLYSDRYDWTLISYKMGIT